MRLLLATTPSSSSGSQVHDDPVDTKDSPYAGAPSNVYAAPITDSLRFRLRFASKIFGLNATFYSELLTFLVSGFFCCFFFVPFAGALF